MRPGGRTRRAVVGTAAVEMQIEDYRTLIVKTWGQVMECYCRSGTRMESLSPRR